MRLLVVVQARTGSTRLPGKVLLPMAGAPMLQRQLERIQAARTSFELCVATTRWGFDKPIRDLCRELGIPCIAGHPTDLLDRHMEAARAYGADAVVKIPSDCPLIDPDAIDRVLAAFLDDPARFDYVSNLHPATWPDGNDVEVMPFHVLETAWREADRPFEREHTTPFLWERPERFRIGNVKWETGRDLSMTHRFTVDYPEDYDFVAAVYEALWTPERPIFRLADILALLDERPDLFARNAHLAGVSWYRHHLAELKTMIADTVEHTRV
jgi:spore coat polysaccharide biosynthesis protein SpsF